MKNCTPFEKQLTAYIHGELSERDFQALEAHLETCGSCRAELEAHRATLALLEAALEAAPAPERLVVWKTSRKPVRRNVFERVWVGPRLKAVMCSVAIHASLFFLAGLLVVFTVVKKDVNKFVPPKAVERPKMTLRQPKVKVKQNAKPKPTTRIVTKIDRATMPDILLPEMSGMTAGFGGGIDGFDISLDLGKTSVFGEDKSIGNDFVGQLYDLKRDRNGGVATMGDEQSRELVDEFILGGWKEADLSRYYRAPNKLYTTHFIIPPIPSPMAPDVFGAPETESFYFFVKYKGNLVYPEDIKFRFWGTGDAFGMIRVDGKLVLLNCWAFHQVRDGYYNMWQSSSADSQKYQLGNQMMAVGDWIELKAGEPVDMELMFGEWRGGQVACMILVEVDGVDYPQTRQGGPLLPAFKTEEFTRDQIEEIGKYLPEGECSLTNGPVFRDFSPPTGAVAGKPGEAGTPASPDPAPAEEDSGAGMRMWTMADGRTFEASFVTVIAGKVSLKNPKGKRLKLPVGQFSEEDRIFIQLEMPPRLDINFSKSSKQRVFPFTLSQEIPRSSYFTFKTTIKKTSTKRYDQELTAEYFAIGSEFGGDKHILLDYRKENFSLTKENGGRFEFSGKPVELLDYASGTGQRRGEKYAGYLVVVSDIRGKSIAHNGSSKRLFENLENLRQVPVGKYFDDTCNRAAPTRPKRFPPPNLNW